MLSQVVLAEGAALNGPLHSTHHTSGLDVERLRDGVYKGLIGLGLMATPVWIGFLVYTPGHLIGWW
jgi:hypothetical protein